jgi:hypothetical protein
MSSDQRTVNALKKLVRGYVSLLESARERILFHGGTCDSVEQMEAGDPYLAEARAAILLAETDSVHETPAEPAPIPMVLQCPMCQVFHIDEPNEAKGWTNPPHRSHECQFCGCVWRPADVPTTGVLRTQTRGKADTWPRQLQVKTGGAES